MVAGDGELRAPIVTASAQAGVPLHALGFRNQTDMPAAYAAADCLALPSTAVETWGLVANEALACARPILVSDQCGCAPDLASGGTAGRTFRVGDIRDFAAAIGSLPFDQPPLGAIAALSRKYSLAAAADGIEAASEFCLGSGLPRKLRAARI